MTTIGKILDNRYAVRAEIGRGGFGAVYLADDTRFTGNNQVAIKKIVQTGEQTEWAFQHEANLLYNLNHPNLPKVTNCFHEDDSNYIVMDFIGGEDLMKRLNNGEKFTVETVVKIADRVLDALEYLHSFQIFHRDIKPHNIKIDPHGKIYLLDFGTAKAEMSRLPLSNTDQSITGYTPFYAPLEQVLRVDANSYFLLKPFDAPQMDKFIEMKTDARSDIYGLGATLYHLLTGMSLESATATIRAHFLWSGKPDSLPDCRSVNREIPDRLAEIVHKCLEIDPDERFQTATDARAALRDLNTVGFSGNTVEKFVPNEAHGTMPFINFETPDRTAPAVAEANPVTTQILSATNDASAPAAPPKNIWGWYVGVPFAVLIALVLGGFFAWRASRSETPKPERKIESVAAQAPAPPKDARALNYSLLVQKMRDGKKFQEPFESSGQEIFESGYQFQINIAPPEDGFLYIFNEGLNSQGEKYFSVIFPTPKLNGGRTEVKGGASYQTNPNEFMGAAGTENFWIIWSREKSEAAEQAIKNAFDNIGIVSNEEAGKVADAGTSANLRNYLEKMKEEKIVVSKDAEKKVSIINFEGDAVAYLLHLEHR